MSSFLYRLGRFAARRPWVVLAAWLLLAVLVVASNATAGKEFEDTFTVPGTDSDDALVLLAEAQSEQGGVSAQVVIASTTPGQSIAGDNASMRSAPVRRTRGGHYRRTAAVVRRRQRRLAPSALPAQQ